ncbi:MAG: acetoacetyl-CoA reductase [Pseudomonadota bacterium]
MIRQKIALVTGGTGGLGTAICHSLHQTGYRVVANYHPEFADQAQQWLLEQNAAGFEPDVVGADVSDENSCLTMAQALLQAHGAIDCIVNNAGITRDARFEKMRVDQWQAVIATNLNSLYYVTHPLIDAMIERQFGRIINISSLSGQTGNFGQTNYSAAKAGVHGFSMALAREVARHGITVNSVSPGFIGTDMVMAMPEEVREQVAAKIPVGRLGTPEEIGRTVAFLADEDSSYITGTDLTVNGGLFMQ